jgi:hypothetical protein
MATKLTALLEAAKNKVESGLPAPLKEPVHRIVLAGMKILYSPQTHQSLVQPIYQAVKARGFQPKEIATGVLNLLAILAKAANGHMALEATAPAGVILLMYILGDLEKTQGLKITPDLIKQTGTYLIATIHGQAQGGAGSPPANAAQSQTPSATPGAQPVPAPQAGSPPAPAGLLQGAAS